jgi:hypothetical protein
MAGISFEFVLEDVNFREEFHDGLTPFYEKGLYGAVNKSGVVVIKPKFDYSFEFRDGVAKVRNKQTNLYGLIDKTGAYLAEPQFESIYDFKDGVAPVKKNGKWGLINLDGKLVIPCKYESIHTTNYPVEVVTEDGKKGLADYNGWVVKPEYESISCDWLEYPVARLEKDGKRTFYHLERKVFLEGDNMIVPLENGYARASKGETYQILDWNGKVVSDPSLLKSATGVTCFRQKEKSGLWKWGFKKGRTVVTAPVYDDADGMFTNGIMRVSTGYSNIGCVDANGKLIIPCEYNRIEIWEKFIVVKKDDKYGIYSFDGTQLVECKFQYLSDMNNVHSIYLTRKHSELFITTVKRGDAYYCGLLDENGREICKSVFDNIEPFYGGIAVARQDDKKCFINTRGEVLFRENEEWKINGGFSEGIAPVENKKTNKNYYIFNPNLR